MLATIEALEREIDQFHKNIKESNELLELLSEFIAASREQAISFEAGIEATQADMRRLPSKISSDFDERADELLAEIKDAQCKHQADAAEMLERLAEQIKRSVDSLAASTTRHSDAVEEYTVASNFMCKELAALPPTLRDCFEEKATEAVAAIRSANEDHQKAIFDALTKYLERVAVSEEAIAAMPFAFAEQASKAKEAHLVALRAAQAEHADTLRASCESCSAQMESVLAEAKRIPTQIETGIERQNDQFLADLKAISEERMAQISKTEESMNRLSGELESKYNSFVAKIEATNMDQLYRYCQDMNAGLNRKLAIAIALAAVAVAVSVVSLFFGIGII